MTTSTLAAPFETEAEYAAAVEELTLAAEAYYGLGDELMVDADYDAAIERVKATEALHPGWKASGGLLTEVAGGAVSGDVKHSTRMLSLDKTDGGVAGLGEWWSRVSGLTGGLAGGVVVEVKVDGAAVVAHYRDGRLTQVVTRGDGSAGVDITSQAMRIVGLPAVLAQPVTMEVRGEVYMTAEQFEEANALRTGVGGKAAFANPRNATAGSLRAQDRTYQVPLSFAAYSVHKFGGDDSIEALDYSAQMVLVSGFGVATALHLLDGHAAVHTSLASAEAAVLALEAKRPALTFEIDGAVVKAESQADRAAAGVGSHAPRWAIAVKFAAQRATTVLRGILREVGRTGTVSLTAALEPVFVGGTTVTRATLHNAKFVAERDLRIGDTVVVYRAGDVIPRVDAVVMAKRPATAVAYEAPTTCPKCEEQLDTESSIIWRCLTPSCSIGGRIEYAASRDCLDIDGLSSGSVAALVEAGLVRDIADLFDLTVEQVAAAVIGSTPSGGERRIGHNNATRIVQGIQAAKTQPLNRVITALGIRKTGRSVGRWLASEFGSLDALRAATVEQIAAIQGLGTDKATYIHDGLVEMSDVIDRLIAAGVQTEVAKAEAPVSDDGTVGTLPFEGMTIVVSGPVPGMSRNDANEAVERLGGRSSGSVSAKTSLLVTSETTTSKAKKAAELGVQVMGPAEFAAIVAAR